MPAQSFPSDRIHPMTPIVAHHLGRIEYGRAHTLQEALQTARIRGEIPDTLLLLEHDPVITRGRTGKESDILATPELLALRGIASHETGRGGEVTLHGPGQLVAYPIFDLRPDRCDVRRYVKDLGEIMMRLGSEFGVDLRMQSAPYIGVWANLDTPASFGEEPFRRAKIGAIGVRLSRWVTMHGFAFNGSIDLSLYSTIVPCGIREHGVTSLEALGVADVPPVRELGDRALRHFGDVFGTSVQLASTEETAALARFVEVAT